MTMASYLSLDVDAPKLRSSQVLKDRASLADSDANAIVSALNQLLAATLTDEVETLPQPSVGVRLVGIVRSMERQFSGDELKADVGLVPARMSMRVSIVRKWSTYVLHKAASAASRSLSTNMSRRYGPMKGASS